MDSLADHVIHNAVRSDPLLFRLNSKDSLLFAKGGSKISRVLQSEECGDHLSVDYLIGQTKLNLPNISHLPDLSTGDAFYDFLFAYATDAMALISETMRSALYKEGARGNPDIYGIPDLISLTPNNGFLFGLDRSKHDLLQNKVVKNGMARRSLPASKTDILIVDHKEFHRLGESLSERQCVAKLDMISAGFNSFILHGREVVTPAADVSFPVGRQYYLSTDATNIALDRTALKQLRFSKQMENQRIPFIEFGMQVILDRFDSTTVAV
jgi:hypothetical protein